ncbi:UNVERIFIED_CONTAM: hypothetical protein FKN15_018452 [Acipenser sinensis]
METVLNSSSLLQDQFPGELWVQCFLSIFLTITCFSLNFVMVFIYFKEPVYQGVLRYMLFIHLLVNDFLQTALAVLLFLFARFEGIMLLSACSVIVLLSVCTSMNTPLNLAVMSLERYVAICFPLHHIQLCTVNRGYIAVALIWLMGILPTLSDISIAYAYGPPGYFQGYFDCRRSLFIILPSQNIKLLVFNAVYFSSIWAVVIYTYLQILITARKATSDKSSASKGQRTVLLHGVQLVLSMSFFIFPLTEYLFKVSISGIGTKSPGKKGQRKEMNVQQNASSQNRFPDILLAQSILLILVTVFFFSLNFVMVFIYFKEPVYQGVPRYMLFIHLLINDFLQAAFSVFLFLNACLQGTMLLSACSVIVLLSACTSMNTPLNLAVMSLERYVAICFPLHHVQLCTVNRGYIAVALIWLMGILPSISDISIAYAYGPPGYFQGYFNCKRSLFMILPSQSTKQAALNAVYFSSIWAVVIYTYIKIMLTARKAASDKSSSSKGQRTVLLHGVQLILSMSFFIYPLTEYFLVGQPLEVIRHVIFFNYYVTLVLPKCLTPLIYGVRDENFKRHLKQYLCLCAKKVQPLGSN